MIRAIVVLALAVSSSAQAACTVIGTNKADSTEFWIDGAPTREPILIALRDGKIVGFNEAVGLDLTSTPAAATFGGERCTFVDVTGMVVTPGFIDTGVALGLVEVGMEDSSVFHNAGGDGVRAAFRATDGYDPLSSLIPITRVAGVTSAVVAPSGGMVSGQSGWVGLRGRTQAASVRTASVGVVAHLSGPSDASAMHALGELLDEASAYRDNAGAWTNAHPRGSEASAADLRALYPVLDGRVPLVVEADRAGILEALARFATERKLRLVVQGGAEAWIVADALAKARVAVVVDPFVQGAGSFDQLHGRADNAALLDAAGVDVIISSGWTHNSRLMPQLAGNAMRGGLSREAAMAALTDTPASVYGLPAGRLAAGAVADIVVWDGDPLELGTPVSMLWIDGEPVALTSRQTALMERYRELPGTPVAPLPLTP